MADMHETTASEPLHDGQGQHESQAPQRQASELKLNNIVDFTWENLTYKVPVEDSEGNITYKTLLHNMSGRACGGRVLAIMGPSGAGKTTLMGAITGKLYNPNAILEGCCFLNNNIYTQKYKRLVSYVSQDDIVMGKDTPREAINFSARVRLGLSVADAKRRTDEVIQRLSLTKCQNTILGIPGILKGVSGGERKRANIGTELVTNPCIMLLDEPTTGLDSVNAVRVGKLLQALAKEDKRTVIATIHSPSSELFDVFDDLLLLAKGHVIYHGTAADSIDYFASLGYVVPIHTNPTEYFMNLLQLPDELLSQLWLAWEDYVMSDAAQSNRCLTPVTGRVTMTDSMLDRQLELKGAGYCLQFTELMKRSWRLYLRDPDGFYSRVAQTVFFMVFLGLFFFNMQLNQAGVQDRTGAIYTVMVNIMYSATISGIVAFPPERAVFLQEQANDAYNAFMYYIAKNIAELPWQILFPTVQQVFLYFMMHFHRSPGAFFVNWFIIILTSNFGYSFGLMLATFFDQPDGAFALMSVILLPLFTVSGIFANTDRLVPYWSWLNYLSFPRFAYMGLHVNEFSRLEVICNPVTPLCTYANGQAVIEAVGFTGWHYWQTFVALLVYQIGLRFIGGLSLYKQGRDRRGRLQFKRNMRNRVATPRAIASARSSEGISVGDSTLVDSIATPSNAYTDSTRHADHVEQETERR